MQKLPHFRPAEPDDGEMPTENLSALLGRVSENSTSQIDDLVGDFGRLREKLRTDGERIQREIPRYSPVLECTPVSFFALDGVPKPFKRKPHNTSFVIEIFVDGLFN